MTVMKWLNNQEESKVTFSADGIFIENKPKIVLCASVFYFRIPRGEWRDRLEKVKSAGYNCIDVYFPWNFHETVEENWDFNGEKDVEAYLALAAELGLWVIARPGPYICSEWDAGGLPTYLLTKDGLVLRDYNELYLGYVKKWYDKIMPIIVKNQLGKQGSVIAVQIENELDFYDCRQIEPYIASLRDYALEAGVQVPIVVCTGQSDIERAGGLVEGVVPTMNFYPELQEKALEDRISHYVEVLRDRSLPFCITETTPSHFILRREFIAGAKFIAPYNQVSGTNFGFTTSVNNWGKPLAYMSHDYNLKGMINPQGECTAEYEEAYLFAGLLRSLEEAIAKGRSFISEDLHISGDCKLSNGIKRSLHLENGGKLVAFPNIDDKTGNINFIHGGIKRPSYTDFMVHPFTCPIIVLELPLSQLGLQAEEGRLAYSTAEISSIDRANDEVRVLFHAVKEAELAFDFTEPVFINSTNMDCHKEDELYVFTCSIDKPANAEIIFKDGKKLYLYGVSREVAVRHLKKEGSIWDSNFETKPVLLQNMQKEGEVSSLASTLQNMEFHKYRVPDIGKALSEEEEQWQESCLNMEDMGYYRGYGWYEGRAFLSKEQTSLGYMIYEGMDVVHLYRNNEYMESFIGDGSHRFIREPLLNAGQSIKLDVRSEIWGHSNFSDSRVQAMDIRSKRGIRGMAVVTKVEDITEYWCYCKDEVPADQTALLSELDKYRPIICFGTYNNPEQPQIGVYKKKIKLSQGSNSVVLELKEFNSYGRVYVDGDFMKEIGPFDSYVTLDSSKGKKEIELAIFLDQKSIQESMKVKIYLYEGKHCSDIRCCGADDKKIAAYTSKLCLADKSNRVSIVLKKLSFEPGEVAVLSGSFSTPEMKRCDLKLRMTGRDAKVLVLLNGIMLGRLWLSSDFIRPEFKGGDDTLLYLPKSYMKDDNQLELIVEAMMGEPQLDSLHFEGVLS